MEIRCHKTDASKNDGSSRHCEPLSFGVVIFEVVLVGDCCGSRGNANNVTARLGTDTIIDPATRWRGEAIKPAQLQVIENLDVAVSVTEKI